MWFQSGTTKVHICSPISGNRNYCYNSEPLSIEKWSTIRVFQAESSGGIFEYNIEINGQNVFTVQNAWPSVFDGVKVYASDPWYPSAPAKVSNFEIHSFPTNTATHSIDAVFRFHFILYRIAAMG